VWCSKVLMNTHIIKIMKSMERFYTFRQTADIYLVASTILRPTVKGLMENRKQRQHDGCQPPPYYNECKEKKQPMHLSTTHMKYTLPPPPTIIHHHAKRHEKFLKEIEYREEKLITRQRIRQ